MIHIILQAAQSAPANPIWYGVGAIIFVVVGIKLYENGFLKGIFKQAAIDTASNPDYKEVSQEPAKYVLINDDIKGNGKYVEGRYPLGTDDEGNWLERIVVEGGEEVDLDASKVIAEFNPSWMDNNVVTIRYSKKGKVSMLQKELNRYKRMAEEKDIEIDSLKEDLKRKHKNVKDQVILEREFAGATRRGQSPKGTRQFDRSFSSKDNPKQLEDDEERDYYEEM